MKGACSLQPVRKPLVPSCNLPTALKAISGLLSEHLDCADLKVLQAVLSLALTSAKRICDIEALSLHTSCLKCSPGYGKVMLCSNLPYVPKVTVSSYGCHTLELLTFQLLTYAEESDK